MEDTSRTFIASPEDDGKRLDAFLAEQIADWSRARLQRLIDTGEVIVGVKSVKSSYKLHTGDEITLDLAETAIAESFAPEDIPLDIVYEDDDIAVVNKPAGMIVHPGAGVSSGTLANALAHHFKFQISDFNLQDGDGVAASKQSKIESLRSKIGLVHRLDKDTSGLLVVAKNETAQHHLSEQFQHRTVYKRYVALVYGEMEHHSGTIDQPLARDPKNRLKMAIVKTGRNAVSLFRVRERFNRFTLLNVEIKTGRTHQIRVHLSSVRHPVVGDELYNAGRDKTVANANIRNAIIKMNRFFLHSEELHFAHPRTGETVKFHRALPVELAVLLDTIRRELL